jgi:Domain of unknown function (DUF929)
MAKAPVGRKRPPAGRPPAKRPPQRLTAAQARAEAARRRRARVWYAAAASALVGVLVVALVVAKLAGGSSSTRASSGVGTTGPTPASVTAQLASIPASDLARAVAAAGTSLTPPSTINGGSPLGANGKPGVLFMGAGYCPYCAAERWALITALLKFGSFTGLSNSHSSSTDINPNTPTFSFHGSTYTSPYLSFTAVEMTTSDANVPLDTPTPAQQALIEKYTGGTIPFVDFDGKYLINGAQYDGKILAGLTVEQVAAQVADPSSTIGKAVEASAGSLVRVLCQLTNGQPGNVCAAFPASGT